MRQFCILIMVLILPGFVATAQSQDCVCQTCKNPSGHRGPEWNQHWQKLRQSARDRNPDPSPLFPPIDSQVVFLDFDSGKDSSIIYTTQQRDEIQANMEQVFAGFNVTFTQTLPSGDFSTIVFNSGSPGGLAQDIDFRNLNKNDNAIVNADGLGLNAQQIIVFSSNIGCHELGHLLGLRHAESFGPIGEGVLPPFGSFFDPEFLGPEIASESFFHIMATPGLTAPLSAFTETLNFLSERSSAKIGFSEDGVAITEMENNNSIGTAQNLVLQPMSLPNKIEIGTNTGLGDFSFSASAVVASIDNGADSVDVFRIDANAGDLFTIEVMSHSLDRFDANPVDANISVFDSVGNFVNYYDTDAFNEHEFESTRDCNIVDLIIENDGPLFLQVDNSIADDFGQYEMWVYRLNGIHGDVNCDGLIDLLDVPAFIETLVSGEYNPKADLNLDGSVNLVDVNPFVDLLVGN